MRMRLSYKMFGAFLLTSFMIVALMVGIIQFFVARGFTDYVSKVEMEKLDSIVKILIGVYEEHEGWKVFKANPALWREVLSSGRQLEDPASMISSPSQRAHREQRLTQAGRNTVRESATEPRQGTVHHAPPQRRSLPLRIRLSLLDAEKRLVAGRPVRALPDQYSLREIVVDEKIVGWLALLRHERFLDPPALGFMQQQSQAFFLTGGGILLLAAVFSFLLSRHLLAPIRQLTAGTQALTSLRFDTRIEVRTGDELGRLATDFNLMAETLEKYERMRKQWVSDIAHELRTPLSILQGEIEAIQDGVLKVDGQTLDSLHSEIVHISRIVNDLHELSMADSGALRLDRMPVNPVETLMLTLAQFRTRFEQARIDVIEELGAHEGIIMQGDPARLAQLYSNLLENTLRYTDKPGTLRIGAERVVECILLSFEDSGPGVPGDALQLIFDRLYRVDSSRSRNDGGSGLGLAICKAITESHGGKITAENASSGGLRIEVRFPIAPNSNWQSSK